MKTKIYFMKNLIVLLSATLFMSCTDMSTDSSFETANFEAEVSLDIDSTDLVPFEEMIQIAESVNLINEKLQRNEINQFQAEYQIGNAMRPFVESGRIIYDKMAELTDFDKLPISERNALVQLDDDTRLAELGLIYSIGVPTYQYTTNGWTSSQVYSCLGAALGLNEIYGLVQNTRALMTAAGVRQVAFLIIRRYIGWIGVAVAVYSFMDCMEAF